MKTNKTMGTSPVTAAIGTLDPGLLTLALERREERVATDSAFALPRRSTNSSTSVHIWRRDPQALQANLRHDDSSQFGGKTYSNGGARFFVGVRGRR